MKRLSSTAVHDPAFKALQRLTSPRKVQDFLDRIPINMEPDGETCTSALLTLRRNTAHCLEGALVAALALWMQGQRPLIMDLKTTDDDVDHVVALFKRHGHWGAITKTNHAVLRYREPIYRTLRELAASYFHEYFLINGKKTLRSYSEAFDLSKYPGDWITAEADLWPLERAIDRSPHRALLTRQQIAGLRRADAIEIQAGELREWRAGRRRGLRRDPLR
jgi:hypothetical protein